MITRTENFPRDFLIEVNKGNVPGHSFLFQIGVKSTVNPSIETVWNNTGSFIWPTGDEALQIVSDNINDTNLGTGANLVVIQGLDSNLLEVSEVVVMDGITPVLTVRTDWRFVYSIIPVLSGSNQSNVGTITLTEVGTGNIRASMDPGKSNSYNGFLKVPSNKYFIFLTIGTFTPKGEDVNIEARVMPNGTNTWVSAGDGPIYQSVSILYEQAGTRLGPGDQIEFRAVSTNSNVMTTAFWEVLVIDSDLVVV